MMFTPARSLALFEKWYPDLPYHNFEHAKHVVEEIERLLPKVPPVDEEVVYLAGAAHDAGYHLVPHHKEWVAHGILAAELTRAGRPELIEPAGHAVLATSAEVKATSLEAQLLVTADLRVMFSDYETFVKNTLAIKQEAHQVYGDFSDELFFEKQGEILKTYLQKYDSSTPIQDVFLGRARNYIARLWKEGFSL